MFPLWSYQTATYALNTDNWQSKGYDGLEYRVCSGVNTYSEHERNALIDHKMQIDKLIT